MEEELQSLQQNNTWDLVPRSGNMNIIGSKWVYRIKYNEKRTIEQFKARLVAKGFTQVPEIDFEETFSPIIKHTIHLVFALALNQNWSMRQFDVRNTFFHGHLNEIVYMD